MPRITFPGRSAHSFSSGVFTSIGYVGAGDIVSGATAWYGLRAYSASTIGNKAIRLREDSGNTEHDFVTVTGGGLDLASITTFKGAANLFVTKLYDQTGNGNDMAQATAASQPAFTLSGFGALPVMTFVSGDFLQTGATIAGTVQPFTLSCVFKDTASGAIFGGLMGHNVEIYTEGTSNTFSLAGTTQLTATCNENVYHAAQAVANGASSFVFIDGVSTSGSFTGTDNLLVGAQVLFIGTDNGAGDFFVGNWQEGGVWLIAFNSGQQSSMNNNQRSYWGF